MKEAFRLWVADRDVPVCLTREMYVKATLTSNQLLNVCILLYRSFQFLKILVKDFFDLYDIINSNSCNSYPYPP